MARRKANFGRPVRRRLRGPPPPEARTEASVISPYEVAKAYWELPLKVRTWKRAAHVLRQLEPGARWVQNRLSRLGRDHEEAGYVRHLVFPPDDPKEKSAAARVPELEAQIAHHFTLRDVVVVSIPEPHSTADQGKPPLREEDADIRVHRTLGLWGARVVLSVLRNEDTFAVGSGRGAFFTALALSQLGDVCACTPNRVVSLMGRLLTRDWLWRGLASEGQYSMDADSIGEIVCRYLRAPKQLRIDRSISEALAEEKRELLRQAISKAGVALVGIGAVTGRSQFIPGGELASQVEKLLKHASRIDRGGNRGSYQRFVGEICGSLFVTTGSQLRALLSVNTDELEREVEEVNTHLLNTSPQELVEICKRGAVVTVAGGEYKAAALSHALNQRPSWISHLIVDDRLANELLRLKREP